MLATHRCSIRIILFILTLTHVRDLSTRWFPSIWCCPISYLIESLIMSNRTCRFAILWWYIRAILWVLRKMSDLFLRILLFRESIEDQRYSVELFFFTMTHQERRLSTDTPGHQNVTKRFTAILTDSPLLFFLYIFRCDFWIKLFYFFFNLFLTNLCELLQTFLVIILHVRVLALGAYASLLAHSCFSCWCDCSMIAFIMVFKDNVSDWKVLRTPLLFLYSHLSIPLHRLSFMNVQFFLLPLTQVNNFKYISCSTLRSGSLLDEFLITLTQITLVIIVWGPVVFAWSCWSCSCSL